MLVIPPVREPAHTAARLLLSQLLLYFCSHFATDPRDNVYALIGFMSTYDDPGFVIDYSLSVREVYINVAKDLIYHDGRQDSICPQCSTKKNAHGLPSWTPDWGTRLVRLQRTILHRAEIALLFSTSNGVYPRRLYSVSRGIL